MNYSFAWLATELKRVGLRCDESDGWLTRGHGNSGIPLGVVVHHTAGPRQGNAPDLPLVIKGRSDLSGPLCNLHLARDGTFTAVAAGLAYHAGPPTKSTPPAMKLWCGNEHTVGIEAENTGLKDDNPWPEAQLACLAKGCAALLLYMHQPVERCVGHFEWAPERKVDPAFVIGNRAQLKKAMDAFRVTVGKIMAEHNP